MTEYMSLEDILAQPDASEVTEEVDLSAFGWGKVLIRQFSIADQNAVNDACTGKDGRFDHDKADAMMLSIGLVQPAMSEAQAAQLLAKRFGPVRHLLNCIQRLSGLTDLALISQQAVNDAERRFRQAPG